MCVCVCVAATRIDVPSEHDVGRTGLNPGPQTLNLCPNPKPETRTRYPDPLTPENQSLYFSRFASAPSTLWCPSPWVSASLTKGS